MRRSGPARPPCRGRQKPARHWIEGTTRRFDGYNYFGVHPEVPVEWFDRHLMH